MADNNRSRLLLLLKYLHKNTDDNHMSSVAELIEMFESNGINGNRNTIRNDVKALNDAGFEILNNVGSSNSKLYHYGSRPFELAELKLFVDAVSHTRFVVLFKSIHAGFPNVRFFLERTLVDVRYDLFDRSIQSFQRGISIFL